MAQNEIVNADDVELILSADGTERGSSADMGRIVVDEFTITREEDISSESGVGQHMPVGLSSGDVEISFSFTMQGEDVSVFEMIATQNGRSRFFSLTARHREDGTLNWEYSLDGCKASSEELGATSGDPMEYSVEGMATSLDKTGTRHDGQNAWD